MEHGRRERNVLWLVLAIYGNLFYSLFHRNGAISDEGNSTNENETGLRLPPTMVRRVGGCCQWISSSSNYAIPEDAVEGGFENGTQLFVARSSFNGGCFPGKLNALTLEQIFPLGDEQRITNEYEVSLIINSNNSSLVCIVSFPLLFLV